MSLSGKIHDPGMARGSGPGSDRQRLVGFLDAAGWQLGAMGALAASYDTPLLRFAHAACPQPLDIVELPPSGEAAALLSQTLGPGERLFFLHRGRIMDRPPRLAYLDAKLGAVMERLGIGLRRGAPVLAVIEPDACPAARAISWSEL